MFAKLTGEPLELTVYPPSKNLLSEEDIKFMSEMNELFEQCEEKMIELGLAEWAEYLPSVL